MCILIAMMIKSNQSSVMSIIKSAGCQPQWEQCSDRRSSTQNATVHSVSEQGAAELTQLITEYCQSHYKYRWAPIVAMSTASGKREHRGWTTWNIHPNLPTVWESCAGLRSPHSDDRDFAIRSLRPPRVGPSQIESLTWMCPPWIYSKCRLCPDWKICTRAHSHFRVRVRETPCSIPVQAIHPSMNE